MVLDNQQVEKFTIIKEDRTEIQAMFNPATLKLNYTADWEDKSQHDSNVRESKFTQIGVTSLNVTLLFDTYGQTMRSITSQGVVERGKRSSEVDVTKQYIKDLVSLIRIEGKLHRPPICTLTWGKMSFASSLPFKCILKSLALSYTMFLADGTPVRAEAQCSFEQWRPEAEDERSKNKSSPDVFKVHVVKRGETLSSISHQHFNSPSYWRHIAKANDISNPHRLEPGSILTIPALKSEER